MKEQTSINIDYIKTLNISEVSSITNKLKKEVRQELKKSFLSYPYFYLNEKQI